MADEQDKKKDRLFGDISVIQVTATALAAVTSVFLASYIGIAGSLIGTAVASVVSTVAASAYKKFMRDSAEKIKELPLPTIPGGLGKSHGADSETASEDEAGTKTEAETTTGAASDKATDTILTVDGDSRADDTERADASEEAGSSTEESDASENADSSDETAKTASSPEDERAVTIAHQKKVQRGLIAVCVVSALLAVAASAAVVYLMTTGEGLGTKPSITYVERSDGSSSRAQHSEIDSTQNVNEAVRSSDNESVRSSDSSSSMSWSSSSASASSSASSASSSAASSSAVSSSSSSTSTPEPPDTNNGNGDSGQDNDGPDSGETTDENSTVTTPIAQRMAVSAAV